MDPPLARAQAVGALWCSSSSSSTTEPTARPSSLLLSLILAPRPAPPDFSPLRGSFPLYMRHAAQRKLPVIHPPCRLMDSLVCCQASSLNNSLWGNGVCLGLAPVHRFTGMSGSTTPTVAQAASPSISLQTGGRRHFTGPARNIFPWLPYQPCANIQHPAPFN